MKRSRTQLRQHKLYSNRNQLTQQNIHCRFAHVIVHVEHLAHLLAHASHHIIAITVERSDERSQHILMESRSYQLSMGSPMVTAADQQTIAQPWFEEAILVGLLDVDAAVEDQLDVERIRQENDQFRADPNPGHIFVGFAQLQSQFKDFYV